MIYIFGRPFVKRFTLCYQSVVCPVCLSVTLVYCGQTVGWIKMKLGMQVGFSPGHIVLDGDPPVPSQKGTEPPIFGPCLLWPKGFWIKMPLGMEVGLGPGHILLEGDPTQLPKWGTGPQFLDHICCGQMAGWIKIPLCREVGLDPSNIAFDVDPAPPPPKKGTEPPNFRSMSIVVKRLDGSRCHLVRR